MSRTGGFKEEHTLGLEQELPKIKKAAGSCWTRLSAGAIRIKPSVIAVAVCVVPDLLGGRFQSNTNEHATPHGGTDE